MNEEFNRRLDAKVTVILQYLYYQCTSNGRCHLLDFKLNQCKICQTVDSSNLLDNSKYSDTNMDRITALESAIRKHHDARGHDRCFENDLDLYKFLPEYKDKISPELPSREEFLQGCSKYYDEQIGKNDLL